MTGRASLIASLVICALGVSGLFRPAAAGKTLYQQCVNARGDTTDGFKASLQAGGLFYNWNGVRANQAVLGRFGQCEPSTMFPDKLFQGANPAGQISISIATFAKDSNGNNQMVPRDTQMVFSSIRNNTALDVDPMVTTFTKAGNNIGTKISTAKTRAAGDPEILITNDGGSAMLLTAINAQINDTEDPLDPNIFFEPDGTPVTLPALDPTNNTILPDDTEAFSFGIGNAANWSFEYTYVSGGDTFTDVLATDVAEPGSLVLFLGAVAGFGAVLLRERKRWGRRCHGEVPAIFRLEETAIDLGRTVQCSGRT